MMLYLLIVVAGATLTAAAIGILVVAWGIRREDAWLSMGSPSPDRLTGAIRRLNGLYTLGIAAPSDDAPPFWSSAEDQWPHRSSGRSTFPYPGTDFPAPGSVIDDPAVLPRTTEPV
jgi:hypothetical protein